MITINNFEAIYPYLNRKADNPDDFWFLQIIKRRKDNPGLPRDMKLIDSLFIKGKDDLEEKIPDIVAKCVLNDARAYIHLNKRNYKKIACETLRIISCGIADGSYSTVKHAFPSACGKFHSDPNKKWLVDIDTKDREYMDMILDAMDECETMNDAVRGFIPTVNGWHVISAPFDRLEFKNILRDKNIAPIDIHTDNPTLLYFSK